MKGKIFPESNNIYQDQAKILFNYYEQAAEKIVQEEERIENQIAELEQEKAAREKEIAGLWVWFLTILLFFIYFIKKNNIQKQIDNLDSRISELKQLHQNIFRDYKVTKMGVAYIPVAEQIKYENKSFIVDYTGKVPDSEVTLQLSRQNDLLIETIGKLDNLATVAPIVESSEDIETIETDDYSTSIQELNQHDYLGNLERSLRTISYCIDDLDTTSVSLPLVTEESSYLNFLRDYATDEIPQDATVIPVFDKERFRESINTFQELNKLKDSLSTNTQQFEDVLKSLIANMANSVQAISALKVASVDKVIMESNNILFQILKSPYNHYSPMLEYEEIERIRNEKFDYSEDVQNYEPFNLKQSSRVKYNLTTGMWTSEDGNTTNMPFGVHQIYEEIVAPVVQNLMQETRIERLKIYNHIKDQKIDYLNKWHQDTDAFYRANRAESADIINLMQESLREYVACYNTLISLQRTEDNMVNSNGALDSTVVDVTDNTSETLAAFELQSQEFQKVQTDFEEYMERLKDDIDLKAEKFGHVEYYDARLRDGYSNEVAVAAGEVHQLEERRKSLAIVNPLFAKTSELPPQPKVEEITYEHMSLNLPVIAKNALNGLKEEEERLHISATSPSTYQEVPQQTDDFDDQEEEETEYEEEEEQEYLDDQERADASDEIPDIPEIPDVPETPDPNLPDIPDIPDIPDVPESVEEETILDEGEYEEEEEYPEEEEEEENEDEEDEDEEEEGNVDKKPGNPR